jgi:uncharacterized membrane protein (UPF0127 family)
VRLPKGLSAFALLLALTLSLTTACQQRAPEFAGAAGEKAAATFRTSVGEVRASPLLVADTAAERLVGLMGRRDLPPDGGMLFLFGEDTSEGFWMKDTPLPLSIAFVDGTGRIVDILDMKPCSTEPCPVYRPNASYVSALEMPQGWFDEHGIGIGDRVELHL